AIREDVMRDIALFLLLMLSPSVAMTGELKDSTAAVALAEKVVQKASTGDVRGGLELARPYLAIPSSQFDVLLGQLEMQAPVQATRYGKSIGYELLRNDTVADSLIRIIYIQKFERHAVFWIFYFYKPKNDWLLSELSYSDALTSAF
ncbi:hypothetical protein J5837_02790, partial [Pseudoxanthomonas helianthi]